jgi:anionic cell wall polymer biosynthesis LytR-Cps2A-Psr (LCP) family protein
MAFCNSCGAVLNDGTKFCNKCGATVAAAPVVAATAPPAVPPTTGGSSALKIVLIVIAVIVVVGVLVVGAFSFFVYRVAKSAHVSQQGDHVKVDSPFGSVETSKDPEQAAKDLGVDIYPGAEVQKDGASSASFGSIHTVTAIFESTDALDKICTFYKTKFPNAVATNSEQNHCTIVSNNRGNMVTINIEGNGDTSQIQITNVTRK